MVILPLPMKNTLSSSDAAHDRVGVPIHEDLVLGMFLLKTLDLPHHLRECELTGSDVDEYTIGFQNQTFL